MNLARGHIRFNFFCLQCLTIFGYIRVYVYVPLVDVVGCVLHRQVAAMVDALDVAITHAAVAKIVDAIAAQKI